MFRGVYTALITPFTENGIDEESYRNIIKQQIDAGVSGIVSVGTTGESPTLSHEEHKQVVEIAIKAADKKCQVIAGTGSNSTAESIDLTLHAQNAGANGALIVTPYYNKPTQEGIYLHFEAIHNKTNIPIIIYNIPGRSVVDISDDTLARIFELERVVAIKDATGDLSRPVSLKQKTTKDIDQLSGEDSTAVEFNEAGGCGVISVVSNIAPELSVQLQNYCLNREFDKAYEIQNRLAKLNDVLFCETNPIPVKYAAAKMGLCKDFIRLPLTKPSANSKALIDNALKEAKLI